MLINNIDEYDYQRYAILFVDDEANTRKYFRRLFSDKFRILEAEDGVEALKIFKPHADEIGIIVTDQRMPNETGVEFLSKISGDYPEIIKILSTAYSDIDAAIGSVNEGGIFRYITKPWDIPQLEVTLRRAMEFYTVKRERDALLGAKMQAMGNVLLSSRLSAFALAPVCAGLSCQRSAEAISSFMKTCVAEHAQQEAPAEQQLQAPHWSDLHARQVDLAESLAKQLPVALDNNSLDERIAALAKGLGPDTTISKQGEAIRISCHGNPASDFLYAVMGQKNDPGQTTATIDVLAAYMAVYDAGASIRRIRGEGLILQISTSPEQSTNARPGSEVAKWLFDDDMLISAALGLI